MKEILKNIMKLFNWLKELWEEFNIQKRWQKILFSFVYILAILFMIWIGIRYYSNDLYYRAWYGDDYYLDR